MSESNIMYSEAIIDAYEGIVDVEDLPVDRVCPPEKRWRAVEARLWLSRMAEVMRAVHKGVDAGDFVVPYGRQIIYVANMAAHVRRLMDLHEDPRLDITEEVRLEEIHRTFRTQL